MPLEMKSKSLEFDFSRGEIQELTGSVNFSRTIRTANCALRAFDIRYRSSSEHPLHRMIIDIDGPSKSGTQANFTVKFGLRDASGTFDDDFGGRVEVLVIADTE